MAEELSLEQKQALALARARLRLAAAKPVEEPVISPLSLASGFNKALGNIVDLPEAVGTAIARPVMEAILGRKPNAPNPGTTYVGRMLRGEETVPLTGSRLASEPRNAGERILESVGRSVADTLPFMAAGGAAALASPNVVAPAASTMGRVAQAIVERLAKAPLMSAAGETAAAASAGLGGGVAREALPEGLDFGSGGKMSPQAVEVIGATIGGVAPSAAGHSLAGSAYKLGRQYAGSVPKGMDRAAGRVEEIITKPRDEIVSELNKPRFANLTPAERAGDEGLYELEAAVRRATPHAEARAAEAREANTQILRDALSASGDVRDTQSFMQSRKKNVEAALMEQAMRRKGAAEAEAVEGRAEIGARSGALIDAMERRKAMASKRAGEAAERVAPTAREVELSGIVRAELASAHKASDEAVAAAWKAVPRDVTVQTTNSRGEFDKLLSQLPKAQLEDMPRETWILKTPGGGDDPKDFLGERTTVNELHGLYAKLGETQRRALADGRDNTVRLATALRHAILRDLGASPDAVSGPVGASLREALDITRRAAETFEQGPVGKILKFTRSGGPEVPEELTLADAMGSGKAAALVGASAIRKAAPTEETTASLREYVLNRFRSAASKDGVIDPVAARKFINENLDLIDTFPNLRDDLLQSATMQDAASRAAAQAVDRTRNIERIASSMGKDIDKRLKQTTKAADRTATARIAALNDESKSYTARFIGADPDKALAAVLKRGGEAASFADELLRQAAKDPTGRAAQGLKASTSSYLMRFAKPGSGLNDALRDPRTAEVAAKFLSPDEMARVRQIADEFERIGRSESSRALTGGVIDEARPSALLSLIARVAGAKIGRDVARVTGGATIQTPGYLSRQARQILDRLTADDARDILQRAVYDKDLMESLVAPSALSKPAAAKFDKWLLTLPGVYLGEDDR